LRLFIGFFTLTLGTKIHFDFFTKTKALKENKEFKKFKVFKKYWKIKSEQNG